MPMTIRFYKDDEMLTYFGTLEPSLEERTVLFNRLWDEYGSVNQMSFAGYGMSVNDINEIRRTFGAFNVVRRGQALRFKNREDLLFVTLKYSKKHE